MNINERFSIGRFLKGFVSTKMIAWIVATAAFFHGSLEASLWVYITLVFMGANVAQDFARRNGGGNA
jgi:hypothetical protein